MSEVPQSGRKSASEIQRMFGQVASRYDLLNHLLSASLDRVWRRRAARSVGLDRGGLDGGDLDGGRPVLDLCCGTGDQALALSRRQHTVVAADFCLPMLALARAKYAATGQVVPSGLAADALDLPFPSGAFHAVTVSFGLRNVPDLDSAISEIHRVLAPGGAIVVLEFAMPTLPVVSGLYGLYFQRILPWIGRRFSASDSAYSYLPQSVPAFPQRQEFVDRLRQGGFTDPTWADLSGGVVCLYRATRS